MILGPEAFEGTWALSRRIEDRLLQQEGTFSGRAELTRASPTELSYHETGTLYLGRGPAMQAERRYLWIFEASKVWVKFDDGREFHSFVPQGQVAGTDHPCGDDFYTVAYDFTRWPQWSATWTVLGPRKDYTSHSHYLRD